MAGCRFGSPDLVTSLSGTAATPTFAFDATNSNYFGLAGSFTSSNGAVCSFPTRSVGAGRTSTYAMTPIIVTTSGNTPKTTTCALLAPPSIIPTGSGSTTYSGIECPSAIDNKFAPGTYTLRFSQPVVNGVPSITSRVFIVASPTTITDSITASVFQTATASAVPTSTSTITEYTSTATETASAGPPPTVTETVSGTVVPTVTVTDVVQSCAPASSSAASSTSVTPSSTTSSASTPTASLPVSVNGQCGGSTGQTCLGSTFGTCCSAYGYCGSSDIYCQASEGCQTGFGTCLAPSPVSSSALPTSTVKVSTDGTCGNVNSGSNGFVCTGSIYGDCCSPYGYCGSSTSHCGAGCQNPFGTCAGSTATVTGTAPLPTSTLKVSLNGACGGTTGQTCQGSDFGNCCSEYGFCGSAALYCTGACQPTFGTCSAPVKRAFVNPKLQPARFAAARRVVKRVIGGAGPDYTYPPIPHTTVTVGGTLIVTVTPTGGVATTTVLGVTTTTIAISGSVVTVTESAAPSTTVTERATITACSTAV